MRGVNIIKIVKSLEEFGLLIKGFSETVKNETKELTGGFLAVILGTLAASLLGSAIASKEVIKGSDGVIRADEGVIRTSEAQDFYCCLILKLILKYKTYVINFDG